MHFADSFSLCFHKSSSFIVLLLQKEGLSLLKLQEHLCIRIQKWDYKMEGISQTCKQKNVPLPKAWQSKALQYSPCIHRSVRGEMLSPSDAVSCTQAILGWETVWLYMTWYRAHCNKPGDRFYWSGCNSAWMWLCNFQARPGVPTELWEPTWGLSNISALGSVMQCKHMSSPVQHASTLVLKWSRWRATWEIQNSQHSKILVELIWATSLSVIASDWSQRPHGLNSEVTKSKKSKNKSWISILWSQNASCKALHWQGSSVRLYNWHPHKLFIFVWVVLERSEVLSYPWKYRWNSQRVLTAECPTDDKKTRAHCLTTNEERAFGKSISLLLKKKN